MIIYLVTAAISIALIYGFIVYKRQTRSDHSFIKNLKKDHDVESLRVQVINEKVGEDKKIIRRRSAETEILIGHGFLVLTQPVLALYNKQICPEGVKGITWPVEINRAMIAEDKALEIDSILPDDETTYTRLIFKGMTDSQINLIRDKSICTKNN